MRYLTHNGTSEPDVLERIRADQQRELRDQGVEPRATTASDAFRLEFARRAKRPARPRGMTAALVEGGDLAVLTEPDIPGVSPWLAPGMDTHPYRCSRCGVPRAAERRRSVAGSSTASVRSSSSTPYWSRAACSET